MNKLTTLLTLCLTANSAVASSYEILSDNEFADLMDKNGMSQGMLENNKYNQREIYIEKYSDNAKLLASMQHKAIVKTNDADPYYRNLRAHADDFATSFTFDESKLANKKVIGYAPSGTFKGGAWTGVTAYFEDMQLGVCKWQILDTKDTGIQVTYQQSKSSAQVHGYPTTYLAEGSTHSGYWQRVAWTNDRLDNELACTRKYNLIETDKKALILEAQRLDFE